MSTDNDMDDLLRDAGQRWRAANPGPAATPDFNAGWTARRRRPRWVTPVAAAAAVVVIAGGTAWFTTSSRHSHTQAAGPGIGSSSAQASGTDDSPFSDLTGPHWKIFDVSVDGAQGSSGFSTDGSTASIHFINDGSFTGSDGCNSISGTAHITATTMTFGDVAVSAIGCTDTNVTRTASAIDAILQGSVTFSVNNVGEADDLYIDHPGVGSLIYFGTPAAVAVTDPVKMRGTWELTEYEQSNGSSGSGGSASGSGFPQGFGDLLVVDADGTFKVQHRCYADVGKVAIGNGTATWSDVQLAGSTPCPTTTDQKDEQTRNALVDSVLTGTTSWQITNGELRITHGDDTIGYAAYASDTGPSGGPTK